MMETMSKTISKEEIFSVIVNSTKEVVVELENHDFKLSDSLQDLGANSIDRSEIVMITMETLDLSFPRVELLGPRNIGELVDLMYDKQ